MSLILISILFFIITNGIEIRIHSDSLKSINNWDKTERHLMGLHTRFAWTALYQQYDFQTQLNEQYGVNILAWNRNLGNKILPNFPETTADAKSCCSTQQDLANYIWTSQACEQFNTGSNQQRKIWGDEYLTDKTTIETYTYMHETCYYNQDPVTSHCYGVDNNHGWGVPKNTDYWWNQLMIGGVRCELAIDPDLKYFHIWNEPNSNWQDFGRDGEDFAQFYLDTAKSIKYFYPDITLAGPVTWDSPLRATTFESWFVPLMKKVANAGRYDVLDYLDWHPYTYYQDPYNQWARWDMTVSGLHAVSLYWRGLTNGARVIRSQLTETNVALTAAQVNDDATYWKLRVIENAKQIMALSHNTDKASMRIQYTMGKDTDGDSHYGWLPYTDKHMQDVIKPIQEGYPIHFEFTDGVQQGYPTYDNGNNIMAQTIYNKDEGTITVLLINYGTSHVEVTLYDKDIKVAWDSTARYTQRWGPSTTDVDITYGNTKATVLCLMQSITAVTGRYRSNPSTEVSETEFSPYDETQLMVDVGYKSNSVDYTVNLWLDSRADDIDASYAYIKFGMLYGAVTDFKWTIKVKVGSTTYLAKYNYINTLNFTQFPIEETSFLSKISKGNTVKIQFIGTRIVSPGYSWWGTPFPGRIAFASLVVGEVIPSSYIKVTNGINLNKWYYAVSLSNIPDGINVKWVKMKSKLQTAWKKGIYDSNTYLWEWRDGPYEAPFDFQIRSRDGQTIYSWDIIDTMNDKDSGVMIQTFGAAYTEDDDAESNGMSAAEYAAIIIAVLVIIGVIGLCIYCVMKRRKMEKAVSFEEKNIEDSKEKPMETEDNNDTPTDHINNNESGGYDMSPISADATNDVEMDGKEEVSV